MSEQRTHEPDEVDQAQVERDVRESVAGGEQPPAPPVPAHAEREAAYGTEHEQGAAQPGPDTA